MAISVQVESAGQKAIPTVTQTVKSSLKWSNVLNFSNIFTNFLEKGFER